MAYFFTTTPHKGLFVSAIITTVGLFIFGYFKSRITGKRSFKGAVKVTSIGLIIAAAAYFVATGFDKLFH